MNNLLTTVFIGFFATAVMDLWGIARKVLFGLAPPNYALVGRWISHMTRGQFRHDDITKSKSLSGERAIGWTMHYLTGVVFAGLLISVWGIEWIQHPSLGPALAIGISTVAAPFLLMQPGMGAGIAGTRTSRPTSVRLQSLITHTVFGLGLYIGGIAAHFLD